MMERIQAHSSDSEFWYTIGLIHAQFEGLMLGYNSAAPPTQVRRVLTCVLCCGHLSNRDTSSST